MILAWGSGLRGTFTTSAARSTSMMGLAVMHGAAIMKEKLIQAAVRLLEVAPEQLSAGEGVVYVISQPAEQVSYAQVLRRNQIQTLEALGENSTKGGIDPETGQGLSSPHWHQGAGAC